MTHELKEIVARYLTFNKANRRCVLATVVALEGSSYRRPGVCMLIDETGERVGAVSGGCVENEIVHQSHSVFADGKPKIITYDGRYRLGCEGVLYILIEPFCPSEEFLKLFQLHLMERKSFKSISYFDKREAVSENYRTFFYFDTKTFSLDEEFKSSNVPNTAECFEKVWPPCFQFFIFGAEHDAVSLCEAASRLGWEVNVVVPPNEAKTEAFFPGIHRLIYATPEDFDCTLITPDAALVLMNHSYARDFHFLKLFVNKTFAYLGLLGPKKRREKLFNDLINQNPDIDLAFFEHLHGPAGLHIGAETAAEIALSILSEILACIRRVEVKPLRDKKFRIHASDEGAN